MLATASAGKRAMELAGGMALLAEVHGAALRMIAACTGVDTPGLAAASRAAEDAAMLP